MSTNLPPVEARIAAQERLQTILSARIEELHLDMQASFRDLTTYHEHLEARLDRIEANMATKADIAAMESRILEGFQQLLAMIDARLPPKE